MIWVCASYLKYKILVVGVCLLADFQVIKNILLLRIVLLHSTQHHINHKVIIIKIVEGCVLLSNILQ